ncbi:unnamed protein product [Rhizophagus irregularis]|nr:unnamed protein product [Rhizophagus irregularis]
MKFHASYNLLQALKITTIFVSIGYAFIIAVFNEQSTKVLMLKEEIEGSEHSLSENMYIDLRTLIMLNFVQKYNMTQILNSIRRSWRSIRNFKFWIPEFPFIDKINYLLQLPIHYISVITYEIKRVDEYLNYNIRPHTKKTSIHYLNTRFKELNCICYYVG